MIPDPATRQTIMTYIRQNSGTYTREAITGQLQEAGYPPADIAAAWAALESDAAAILQTGDPGMAPDAVLSTARRPVARDGQFWLAMVGFTVASYLVGGGLIAVALAMSGNASSVLSLAGLVLFALIQLAGLIGWVMLMGRNRPVAIGLLTGVLLSTIVIPFIIACGVAGICIYLFNQTSTP